MFGRSLKLLSAGLLLVLLLPVGVAQAKEVLGFGLGEQTVESVLSELRSQNADFSTRDVERPRNERPKITIHSGYQLIEKMGRNPVVVLLYTVRVDWVDTDPGDLAQSLKLSLTENYGEGERGVITGQPAITYRLGKDHPGQFAALIFGKQVDAPHNLTLLYLDELKRREAEAQVEADRAIRSMEWSDRHSGDL